MARRGRRRQRPDSRLLRHHRHRRGFTLSVDGETSHPFDIGADLYAELRRRRPELFYPAHRHRDRRRPSPAPGTAARPATRRRPQPGRHAVPCQPGRVSKSTANLDLRLHARRPRRLVRRRRPRQVRRQRRHRRRPAAGRVRARLPPRRPARSATARCASRSAATACPDVLDEARWELEWMLRMQVPAGQPLRRHGPPQVHDSGLDRPAAAAARTTRKPRELHRPSTAATLNLAAVAQGARLLARATTAPLPTSSAPPPSRPTRPPGAPGPLRPAADGTGGGAYDDTDVTDEFYWAAAELYLTTGEQLPRRPQASPLLPATSSARRLRLEADRRLRPPDPGPRAQRLWPRLRRDPPVGGRRAPTATSRSRPTSRSASPTAALRQPVRLGLQHLVINNAVVLATAYDLTGRDEVPRRRARGACDYLFGRNALNISYVTGYGDVFSQNQHTRWFAHRRRRAAAPAGRHARRRPELVDPGPGRASAARRAGLRAAVLLRRRHPVLVDQRDHHQLELGSKPDGGMARRAIEAQKRQKGAP